MKTVEILTRTNGAAQKVLIECDRQKRSLTLILEDGSRRKYEAHDLYECFGQLRSDFPETEFLCKGAKLNVHPSRMSSQMSAGLMAYELHLGVTTESEDVVNIFDYEETDLTNDIQKQRYFYKNWIESLNP